MVIGLLKRLKIPSVVEALNGPDVSEQSYNQNLNLCLDHRHFRYSNKLVTVILIHVYYMHTGPNN